MVRLDVDDHLAVVGNLGRYQWMSLLVNGCFVITFASQIFAIIFNRYTPPFRCIDGDFVNITSKGTYGDSCTYILPDNTEAACTTFEFDQSMFHETIVTKFQLVCDRKYMNTALSMAWMASVGVGTLITCYLGDMFIGRKPVLVFMAIGTGILGSIEAFSVNYAMYITINIILGLTCGSIYASATCFLMESVAPLKRPHVANMLEFFWVFGASSLSLIAYVFHSWWQIQLFISLPSIATGLVSIWLLSETPHWLYSKGKYNDAVKSLNRIAKVNKIKQFHLSEIDEESDSANIPGQTPRNGPTENICKIWFYKRLLARIAIISFGWISVELGYYYISFGVANLGGNIYLNNFLLCIVEAFAYTYCFGIAYWGRKWPTVGVFFLGGLSLLISILVIEFASNDNTAIIILSIIGKFAVSAAWQCIIVWNNELSPTSIRCTTNAINSLAGRIGSVLAPLLIDLPKLIEVPKEDLIIPSVFVIMMVGAGLLHIIPPETNKCKIPDSMEEANQVSFPLANDGKDNEDEETADLDATDGSDKEEATV